VKSAKDRKKSLNGVYRIRTEEALRGKRVLLLDDVVTTGATLHTCVHALQNAGVAQVVCLAIADVQ
jgi:predicted amidophosphoribosyltransferase